MLPHSMAAPIPYLLLSALRYKHDTTVDVFAQTCRQDKVAAVEAV
jgi:hypothetical protein